MRATVDFLKAIFGFTFKASAFVLETYATILLKVLIKFTFWVLASGLIIFTGMHWHIEFLVFLGFLLMGLELATLFAASAPIYMSLLWANDHIGLVKKFLYTLFAIVFFSFAFAIYVLYTGIWERPILLWPMAGLFVIMGIDTVVYGNGLPEFLIRRSKVAFIVITIFAIFTSHFVGITEAGQKLAYRTGAQIEDVIKHTNNDSPQRIYYSGSTLNCYDTVTQKLLCWYYKNNSGEYELYNRAGFHPETGEPLSPITRDVIKEVKKNWHPPEPVATPMPATPVPTPTFTPPSMDYSTPSPPDPTPSATPEPAIRSRHRPELPDIPAGTYVTIHLTKPLSTELNKTGDEFEGYLVNRIVVGDQVVAEGYAPVYGQITLAQEASRSHPAYLSLTLKEIKTTDNKWVKINTQLVRFEGKKKEGWKKILGGTVGGTVIGAIIDGKDGAKKGAVLGATAGTTAAILTKNGSIEIHRHSTLCFYTN